MNPDPDDTPITGWRLVLLYLAIFAVSGALWFTLITFVHRAP